MISYLRKKFSGEQKPQPPTPDELGGDFALGDRVEVWEFGRHGELGTVSMSLGGDFRGVVGESGMNYYIVYDGGPKGPPGTWTAQERILLPSWIMASCMRRAKNGTPPSDIKLHNGKCPACGLEGTQERSTVFDESLGTLAWVCPNKHCFNTYPDGRPY